MLMNGRKIYNDVTVVNTQAGWTEKKFICSQVICSYPVQLIP